jgi:Helix-turn-helix domain
MTQNSWLLRHLKSGHGITTLQAHRYGICRLSERCRELEKAGHKIKKTPKRVGTRYGNGTVRVVEYRIG